MEDWDDDDRRLYYAAAWSELETIQTILDGEDINIDTQNPANGNTPLYIASAWGSQDENTNFFYLEIAQLLIDYKANVNLPNKRGQTPLYIAAAWGHTNIVQLLIKHGGDVHVQMNEGRTPLHIGALSAPHLSESNRKYGNYTESHKYHAYNLARGYMERIKSTGEYSNYLTTLQQDYEMLVAHPANPNEDVSDDIMDIVVIYNHFATVVELVQAGANVNVVDDRQETPLAKATYSGHLPLVKFLVDRGANINVLNDRNRSIADIAAGRNHSHVVQYLNEIQTPNGTKG